MTAQQNIEIFGNLVVAEDIPTEAEELSFQDDLKIFDGEYHRIENAILNIARWTLKMEIKYGKGKFNALCAKYRPQKAGRSTRESCVALLEWNNADPNGFDYWRKKSDVTLSILYDLSKTANRVLRDTNDIAQVHAALEDAYPRIFERRKGYPLLNGNGDEQPTADSTDAIRAVAPGLATLVDAGKVHPAEAERIIRTAAKADFDAAETVRLFGVRDTASVDTLDKIAKSLTNSPERALGHVADIFRQMRTTDGFVTLPEGEQVHVADLSARELWSAYANASKEHEISDPQPKAHTVLTEEINTNDVKRIATLLEAETVLNQMREMPPNVWFALTIKTIPVEG